MKRELRHLGSNVLSTPGIKREKAPAFRPVEALEPRLLLSGNVQASVVSGNLIIRGNVAANVIVLDQPGLNPRKVRISGASGTTINHQTGPVVLRGVRNGVDIQLGAGRDRVSMSGLSLPGNVLVNGQRHLTLDNVQVAKTLNILSIASTTISNTAVGENLVIRSGLDGENVALQGVAVHRNTRIVGGSGADVITVQDSTFNGAVRVRTGAGKDLVQIEANGDPVGRPTRFRGPASIGLATGNDALQVGVAGQAGNRAVFSNAVFFDGGPGFDALSNPGSNTYIMPSLVSVINFESNPLGQARINLGAAGAFAVMATASISSTGPTHINGNVGLNPGSSQGIPTAQVNGTIHVNDPDVVAARADLLAAYNDAVSRSVNSISLPGNLGGLTFTPGLYTNSTSVLIKGSGPGNNVTLDAQGDPNAIFIFKMGSTLTTGPGAQVILAGGAKAGNIFWQVGTSATLNTTTIFKGNILAAVTITVNTGSVVKGRLLAGSNSDGSVTVNASTVTVPGA